MNAWATAALGLFACLIAPAYVVFSGGTFDRLIAVQFAGTVTILALILLAVAFGESSIMTLAVAAALLSLPGNLAFIVIYERWL